MTSSSCEAGQAFEAQARWAAVSLALLVLQTSAVAQAPGAASGSTPVPAASAATGGAAAPASAPITAVVPAQAVLKIDFSDNAPPAAAFSTAVDQVKRNLELVIDSKVLAGKVVSVTVSQVQLNDGGSITLNPSLWDEKEDRTRTFEKDKPIAFPLRIQGMTAAGEYTGTLTYSVEGVTGSKSKTFRVLRAAAADLPLEVVSVQRLANDEIASFGKADRFRLVLQGAADRALTVTPTLLGVTRTGATQKTDPIFENATFKSWDASAVPASPPPNGAETKSDGKALGAACAPTQPAYGAAADVAKLPAGGFGCIEMELTGVGAGEYSGTLGFTANSYRQKTATFSFAVRKSAFLALFCIFLGTLITFVLKRLASSVRPRLVVRTAVSELLQQANPLERPDLTGTEALVLGAIRNRLLAIFDETLAPGDPPANFEADMSTRLALERKRLLAFPYWANARRLLASATDLPPDVSGPFETTLKDAEAALTGGPVADGLATRLLTLIGDLKDAIAASAKKAVDAAQAAITNAQNTATTDATKSTLQSAGTDMAQAAKFLANHDFARFKSTYDAARLTYYKASTTGMAQSADEAAKAPVADHIAKVQSGGLFNLEDVAKSFGAVSGTLGTNQATRPAPVPGSGIDVPARLLAPLVPKDLEDPGRLRQQTRRLDLAIDAVSVVAASLVGVLTVWMPSPGWGSTTDIFAALLWGMGLFTVGNAAALSTIGAVGAKNKLTGN